MATGYTTTNVLIGAAAMFTQPFVPGTPPALPADTVAFVDVTSGSFTTWTSPWSFVGATDQGLSFNVQKNTQDETIEEQDIPVAILPTSTDVQIVVSFAEDTLATMKLAYGGGTIVTTAAASAVTGVKELTLQSNIDTIAVGFEGKNPVTGGWRRVLIPQMNVTGQVQTPYRRAAGKRIYPVTFRAICAPSQIRVREFVAAALP